MGKKKTTWNISKILMFALVLIILPAGSFWYLGSGLTYYKERLSEMDSLGVVPYFYHADQYGDSISNQQMRGKWTVMGYFSSDCGAPCDTMMQVYEKIQRAFPDGHLVQAYSFYADSSDVSRVNNDENNCNWFWLKGEQDGLGDFFENDIKVATEDHYSPQLALVDSSLVIRKYYDALNPQEVDQLILHMSMFAPRPPKRKIKFRREEEK